MVILASSLLCCPDLLLGHQTQTEDTAIRGSTEHLLEPSYNAQGGAVELRVKPAHIIFVSHLTSFFSLGNLLNNCFQFS